MLKDKLYTLLELLAYRDFFIIILFTLFSALFEIDVDDFFMSTIYTVLGIMFSIGISILVTFNMHEVKKKSFINKIRFNLNKVRDIFIWYFVISTVAFILEKYLRRYSINKINIYQTDNISIAIDISSVIILFLFYSILYFILNFLEVQRLNNEIFDNTRLD